jgi:hypothetical protein
LANCGNLKFPDLNFTVFGEKTLKKNRFWHIFPNIFGENMKKNMEKLGIIWKNWKNMAPG